MLKEGAVSAGEAMRHEAFAGERVSVSELMKTYPYRKLDLATVARYLAVPAHRALVQELHELYG